MEPAWRSRTLISWVPCTCLASFPSLNSPLCREPAWRCQTLRITASCSTKIRNDSRGIIKTMHCREPVWRSQTLVFGDWLRGRGVEGAGVSSAANSAASNPYPPSYPSQAGRAAASDVMGELNIHIHVRKTPSPEWSKRIGLGFTPKPLPCRERQFVWPSRNDITLHNIIVQFPGRRVTAVMYEWGVSACFENSVLNRAPPSPSSA